MSDFRVISPMGLGNGAYIVHKILEAHIPWYRVESYHPYWTLFPFALKIVTSTKGADLIHTTSDYGIFFHRKKIPLVLTIHGYMLDSWIRTFSTWPQQVHCATDLRLFTKMSLCKASVVTAVSHYIARLTQENLQVSIPIKIIYNGVDTNMFFPIRHSITPQKEVRVFFSGNLKVRKGSHWLPDIAQRLNKNIRIFYTQGLRAKKNLPPAPNLESIGAVPFKQMPDRYRQMDILLMPTVR
jgi:L-malate glycosyltransferase